ncbi:copper transporter [Biomaibacter acetigenes]|nr:copper transporter [Biomaibacter acetigenes]
MYSLKHFAILLIAVFLALGIGIAIGLPQTVTRFWWNSRKRL